MSCQKSTKLLKRRSMKSLSQTPAATVGSGGITIPSGNNDQQRPQLLMMSNNMNDPNQPLSPTPTTTTVPTMIIDGSFEQNNHIANGVLGIN